MADDEAKKMWLRRGDARDKRIIGENRGAIPI